MAPIVDTRKQDLGKRRLARVNYGVCHVAGKAIKGEESSIVKDIPSLYTFRIRFNRSPTDTIEVAGNEIHVAVESQDLSVSLRSSNAAQPIRDAEHLALYGVGGSARRLTASVRVDGRTRKSSRRSRLWGTCRQRLHHERGVEVVGAATWPADGQQCSRIDGL